MSGREDGPGRGRWRTLVAIMDDDAGVNQAINDLRGAGIKVDGLTVVLKREDPDEPEPFPGERATSSSPTTLGGWSSP